MQTEKDNAAKGLVKAKKLVVETTDKVQAEKDKIHLVEVQNEKNAIDYRTLQKYREEITVLLDSVSVCTLWRNVNTDVTFLWIGFEGELPRGRKIKDGYGGL